MRSSLDASKTINCSLQRNDKRKRANCNYHEAHPCDEGPIDVKPKVIRLLRLLRYINGLTRRHWRHRGKRELPEFFLLIRRWRLWHCKARFRLHTSNGNNFGVCFGFVIKNHKKSKRKNSSARTEKSFFQLQMKESKATCFLSSRFIFFWLRFNYRRGRYEESDLYYRIARFFNHFLSFSSNRHPSMSLMLLDWWFVISNLLQNPFVDDPPADDSCDDVRWLFKGFNNRSV